MCCRELERPRRGSPGHVHEHALQLAERLLDALNEPYDVHGHEMLVGASIGIAGASGEELGLDRPAALERRRRRVPRQADGPGPGRDVRRRAAPPTREGAPHRAQRRPAARPAAAADPVLAARAPRRRERRRLRLHRRLGGARACASSPTRSPGWSTKPGMSRALDVALVRTVLAQLARLGAPAARRDRPRSERHADAHRRALAGAARARARHARRAAEVNAVAAAGWVFPRPPSPTISRPRRGSSIALDALGVGVALRDFGSAVSSLEQLRRLPAPTMTIAGPLVAAVPRRRCDGRRREHRPCSPRSCSTRVRWAASSVAFGVQDAAHARRLRELGCDFGTGPAFGPPIRPDQVEQFLRRASLSAPRTRARPGETRSRRTRHLRLAPWPDPPAATTPPSTSRCSRASTRSANGPACTSVRRARPACITSCGRSSTTRSTRRWPASARAST